MAGVPTSVEALQQNVDHLVPVMQYIAKHTQDLEGYRSPLRSALAKVMKILFSQVSPGLERVIGDLRRGGSFEENQAQTLKYEAITAKLEQECMNLAKALAAERKRDRNMAKDWSDLFAIVERAVTDLGILERKVVRFHFVAKSGRYGSFPQGEAATRAAAARKV